jgi:hypothetical protein
MQAPLNHASRWSRKYTLEYFETEINPIAPMRILQLIDSLEAGGAERMAVITPML